MSHKKKHVTDRIKRGLPPVPPPPVSHPVPPPAPAADDAEAPVVVERHMRLTELAQRVAAVLLNLEQQRKHATALDTAKIISRIENACSLLQRRIAASKVDELTSEEWKSIIAFLTNVFNNATDFNSPLYQHLPGVKKLAEMKHQQRAQVEREAAEAIREWGDEIKTWKF